MDFNDILRMIQGGGPASTVMDAQAAAPAPAPPPAPSGAPQGVPTPVTNPKPPAQAPQAYQSPSDLANMYVQLMKDNRNAQQLDSGLNLIAAGLSNSPTNRAALIAASGHGGGSGGMSLSANDMINFQKQAEAQRQQLIMRQALPALMKQYGWTPAQAQALLAGGKLDEVLKHHAEEGLAQVTDANGQVHMVAPRTGKIITTIGSEKEDPTQVVAGPGGPQVINMRTGQPVAPGVGLPADKVEVTRPDGSKIFVDKTATPSGTEVAPRAKPGDVIDPLENQLAAINAENTAAGKPLMTMPELIKLKQTPATNINVGMDGSVMGKAPEGYEWERDKATGKILLDENGHAKYYKPEHGKPADEAVKLAKETADAVKKERIAKAQTAFAAGNVGQAVRNAFEVVDKPGATGFLSKPARSLGIGGTPADDMDAALSTINANTAFQQLRSMREASASGASGLGQLTEKEGQMLSSVIADLRAYQSTGKVKEGLARVEAAMTLLAGDSFEKGTDIEGFNRQLSEQTQQILAREFNKKSGAGGSKVRVVPR